jgi:hypothetical protein
MFPITDIPLGPRKTAKILVNKKPTKNLTETESAEKDKMRNKLRSLTQKY